MEDLTSKLRVSFLEFFASRDHKIVESAPLAPQNDPSLLFINAGMAPLKGYFLGQEAPPAVNLVSCQKCIRAGGKHNDLDQVGYTKRHHTFFEMCGNFSFGGYGHETAIKLAWEFLTEVLKLDPNKLWITVHPEDPISKKVWSELVSVQKIVSLAENEWAMGDEGPCGMCTEIFFDHGEHLDGTVEEGDRFVEIWNIVFMTHQVRAGVKTKLPHVCIDTGMGLERICAVMSGTDDNYKAPLFTNIIQEMSKITGKPENPDYRIIADHARAAVFAISDGIVPDTSSRGYVIRKIIRRALVRAHQYKNADLMNLAMNYMINVMGEDYPQLKEYRNLINSTLATEKHAMDEILFNAWHLIEKNIKNSPARMSGETVFFLYDTHGIPVEVIVDILTQKGIEVDLAEYESIIQKHHVSDKKALPSFDFVTQFVGYSELKIKAILLDIKDWENNTILIFDRTPFYPESGGQESDTGKISDTNSEVEVLEVKKVANTILHICNKCQLEIGTQYDLEVNSTRRSGLAKHHSATHLLLYALRYILGPHVTQKGSLVKENLLRFDFLNDKPVEKSYLQSVETLVNQMILANHQSQVQNMSKVDAINKGAIATFGEKYGETVRVVNIGESTELCGGTHVQNSGEIGSFYILREKGVAAGIRRIEAVAGFAAYEYAKQQINLVRNLSDKFATQPEALEQAILKKMQQDKPIQDKPKVEVKKMMIQNYEISICLLKNSTQGAMLKLSDEHILENDSVILINDTGQKYSVIIRTKTLNAVNLFSKITQVVGGKGGGKSNLAQGSINKSISYDEIKNILSKAYFS